MSIVFTKKDIISFNERFDKGNFHNEPSLDFALSYAKKTQNWTKALAWIVRAILIDHVFEEANKRTVALMVKTYIEYEGFEAYNDKIVKMIKKILFSNITNIQKIEGLIQDAIKNTKNS